MYFYMHDGLLVYIINNMLILYTIVYLNRQTHIQSCTCTCSYMYEGRLHNHGKGMCGGRTH